MKIFIDVGGNEGQTVGAVFEPTYGYGRVFCKYEFDRIYCFEPVPELRRRIAEQHRDPRVVTYALGLWKETCEMPVYSPGTQSASIFADKVNVDPLDSTVCKFVRASDWFREHLTEADEVYLKLNCEGCEADIVEDLLDTDEYRKVTSLGLTFDVRKIPSQRHREEEVKQRLRQRGYDNYVDLNLLHDSSSAQAVRKWLSLAGADRGRSLSNRLVHVPYYCRTFISRALRSARRRLAERWS